MALQPIECWLEVPWSLISLVHCTPTCLTSVIICAGGEVESLMFSQLMAVPLDISIRRVCWQLLGGGQILHMHAPRPGKDGRMWICVHRCAGFGQSAGDSSVLPLGGSPVAVSSRPPPSASVGSKWGTLLLLHHIWSHSAGLWVRKGLAMRSLRWADLRKSDSSGAWYALLLSHLLPLSDRLHEWPLQVRLVPKAVTGNTCMIIAFAFLL